MACASKLFLYVSISVFFVCVRSGEASGKDGDEGKSVRTKNSATLNFINADQFQWAEHPRLSWDDFRGAVNALSAESAAATHCGIAFRATTAAHGRSPAIVVYNTFYVSKSWVRDDARIPSILEHEQGHFDICEIYTRRLRDQMKKVDMSTPELKKVLMNIYTALNSEYEARQMAYEDETSHGTNLAAQKKWRDMIDRELM